MIGYRKIFVYVITLISILTVFFVGIFKGVEFNSSDIVAITMLISVLSGAYAGANVGEHFARAKLGQNNKHSS